MYADFARTFFTNPFLSGSQASQAAIPAEVRTAMAEQGRRVIAFNQKVVDWQLSQVKASEKQFQSFYALSLETAQEATKAILSASSAAIDAFDVEKTEAA